MEDGKDLRKNRDPIDLARSSRDSDSRDSRDTRESRDSREQYGHGRSVGFNTVLASVVAYGSNGTDNGTEISDGRNAAALLHERRDRSRGLSSPSKRRRRRASSTFERCSRGCLLIVVAVLLPWAMLNLLDLCNGRVPGATLATLYVTAMKLTPFGEGSASPPDASAIAGAADSPGEGEQGPLRMMAKYSQRLSSAARRGRAQQAEGARVTQGFGAEGRGGESSEGTDEAATSPQAQQQQPPPPGATHEGAGGEAQLDERIASLEATAKAAERVAQQAAMEAELLRINAQKNATEVRGEGS